MKRAFDIVVSLISLVILAVPLLLIALAIKISSRGPVLFRQQRIGRGGHPFWLYKFRTMRPGQGGAQVTAAGDRRITPLGRFLRRWKLDELPQFFNVLRGDMSVIGPRPEVERFVVRYTPQQRRLLEQTPGLAGLSALVYQHEADLLYGHADPEEAYVQYVMPRKIAVDLDYESGRTFWSDLRLLAALGLALVGWNPRLDRNFRLPAPVDREREKA